MAVSRGGVFELLQTDWITQELDSLAQGTALWEVPGKQKPCKILVETWSGFSNSRPSVYLVSLSL